MVIQVIVALNLLLTIYNVYMLTAEGRTISDILDWIIEHDKKEGKEDNETA